MPRSIHSSRVRVVLASATCAVATFAATSRGGDYRVERIASGLTQPNYVTQAPGDPSSVLYYVERIQAPTDGATYAVNGFNRVNHMGKIVRHDTATGVRTTVLDLYDRKVFQDTGLQHVSFSPDFATNGKMYVTSSTYTGAQAFGSNGTGAQPVPTNRVEEYTVNVANPSAATTTLTNTVLSYTNNTQNNHTINGAWFDPTATGAARNYLYISTGDGAFGNQYNGGAVSGGRPSQNPASIRGKIHRVDVSGGDAYPNDSNKNFAIPATNPLPTYNRLHPTTPISGPGEMFISGMRNAYRMSFDRANGDLYMGDVGENLLEEIDFLRAGTNTGENAPPADFGWPQLEGTQPSPVGGAPHTNVNPFTGAISINPILQYPHSGGSAVIGGYVYRGAVQELQGKYFYADFVPGTINALDFERLTATDLFNGANGTVTTMSAVLNSLVFDANDPNYTEASVGATYGLDHVVSFGEDASGNLLLVDFGGVAGDANFGGVNGQYPAPGLGEIFRIVLNGDLDRNNVRNANDIDIILRVGSGQIPPRSRLYDLNNDNTVLISSSSPFSDSDYLIRTLLLSNYGDTNLDRKVNFDDLLTLAQNYGAPAPAGWAKGDFNGDNSVNFDDLLALAQQYGFGTGAILSNDAFAADWALAQSLVPEPGVIGAVACGSLALLRGRRRR